MYCNSGSDYYYTSSPCDSSYYDNDCGCYNMFNDMDFSSNPFDPRCLESYTINQCTAGQVCTMNCDCNTFCNSCSSEYINGTAATFLEVTCGQSYYCQNSYIACPDSGCDIVCTASNTCQGVSVAYKGSLSDRASINITCNGYYAVCFISSQFLIFIQTKLSKCDKTI